MPILIATQGRPFGIRRLAPRTKAYPERLKRVRIKSCAVKTMRSLPGHPLIPILPAGT